MLYYSQKEYRIRVNNRELRVNPYMEKTIKVPVKPLEKVYANVWERFLSSPDVAQEEVHYKKITVLRANDVEQDEPVFFITEKDKGIIKSAMECGARYMNTSSSIYSSSQQPYNRACRKLITEDRYGLFYYSRDDTFDEEHFTEDFKVLYGCWKRRSYVIEVKSLSCIKDQFVAQDQQEERERQEAIERCNAQIRAEQAKREEEERRRKEQLARIRQELLEKIVDDKEEYSAVLMEEFDNLKLLSRAELTNREKIEEYAAVRDFCIKHMPELADRSFKPGNWYAKYVDYFDITGLEEFLDNWRRLNRSYYSLIRGERGEEKIIETLQLFDDRFYILHGYTWGKSEHDFIVISPYGIFTIEVKNLYGDYVVTKTGLLKCVSQPQRKAKDIAFQSKRHRESLRRNLKECAVFSEDIPIREIICSADPYFSIEDEYGYIPVCNHNTLDKLLLPDGEAVVLSDEAMLAIKEYLTERWCPAFAFPVFLPKGEIDSRDSFIRNFAEVASGLYAAHKNGL